MPAIDVPEGKTVVAVIGPAAPALLDSRSRAVAEATAAAASAAIDLARAQLAQAEATLEFMTSEANRATALYQKGAVSQRSHDSALRESKTAQAAVSSALANLAVREKELESALAVLNQDQTGDAGRCCVRACGPGFGPRAAGADRKRTGGSTRHSDPGNRRSRQHGDRGGPSVPAMPSVSATVPRHGSAAGAAPTCLPWSNGSSLRR